MTIDDQGRPEPPVAAGEVETLLDYQRATFEWKWRGLDTDGLFRQIASSSMTLGGLINHLSLVEDYWFSERLLDAGSAAPWDAVDWQATPDWDWDHAAELTPDELAKRWHASVEQSRIKTATVLDQSGLDTLALKPWPDGRSPSLRWIVLHMIEEYARHNGHADLLREAVDGETGE
jgi:uncharacterized damage-inducible protein DinB